MFHVRRRPADSHPRRRKKKPLGVSNGGNNMSVEREGPMLVEITHSGEGGRRVKLGSEPIEVCITHQKKKKYIVIYKIIQQFYAYIFEYYRAFHQFPISNLSFSAMISFVLVKPAAQFLLSLSLLQPNK